ncbi:MAG: GntR family transcriptional regulator [Prolixibacteraceae bacterium]|nr:GntR family transcriptional regulator [Prolixibacteraceae bacterium]
MVKIGKISTLEVVKFTEQGAYLDGGPYGEILLPKRYVTESLSEGDDIEVFIYYDSEDRIVATTEKPLVQVGEFAPLEVVETTKFGAFLDWGLPKNLLVPFREQKLKMEAGKKYVVYVYVDEKSGRIAGTAKIDKFLEKGFGDLAEGDKVELLIANKTDLGVNAIVEGKYQGILYDNELFKPVRTGDVVSGYIKKIRDDEKIDLTLEKIGYDKVDPAQGQILEKLNKNDGFLPFNDKSDPDVIKKELAMSKKTFKKAVGALYKSRKISIEDNGIKIV